MSAALTVERVKVSINRNRHEIDAVTDVAFEVAPGEALGLVGESGCGKSLTLRALADILPGGTRISDLEATMGTGPDHRVAMIFQEPLGAMSPTKRVIDLVAEGVMATRKVGRKAGRERALELLREVGVPDPEHRARMWPHELSGGLRQRVVIAMALATEPSVLLCDEPTTALDVTVQDQILGLLDHLRTTRGMSMVFVTHDMSVVATLCQRVAVMYAGQIVESGPTRKVLDEPTHPYTAALLRATRARNGEGGRVSIVGSPPDPSEFVSGCRFAPRCEFSRPQCAGAYALRAVAEGQTTACVRFEDLRAEGAL